MPGSITPDAAPPFGVVASSAPQIRPTPTRLDDPDPSAVGAVANMAAASVSASFMGGASRAEDSATSIPLRSHGGASAPLETAEVAEITQRSQRGNAAPRPLRNLCVLCG